MYFAHWVTGVFVEGELIFLGLCLGLISVWFLFGFRAVFSLFIFVVVSFGMHLKASYCYPPQMCGKQEALLCYTEKWKRLNPYDIWWMYEHISLIYTFVCVKH